MMCLVRLRGGAELRPLQPPGGAHRVGRRPGTHLQPRQGHLPLGRDGGRGYI